MLVPTDGQANIDTEEAKQGSNKKGWLELMHRGAENQDWRTIEHQTALEKYKSRMASLDGHLKMGTVNIDDGTIIGKWVERGSYNQAGSMLKTTYDPIHKKIYAVAAGGSIWKADIQGLEWELVIDELRFDPRFLEVVYPIQNSNSPRILASINGIPFYFETLTGWKKAEGFPSEVVSQKSKDQIKINNGKDILFLAKDTLSEFVSVFHSDDYGNSYSKVRELSVKDIDNAAMHAPKNSNSFYLIEETNNSFSKIYKWNNQIDVLELIKSNSPTSFGDDIIANIDVVKRNNQDWLYIYDKFNTLRVSKNQGNTWENLKAFNFRVFEGGVFISDENPNLIIVCGINAHISRDAGITWDIINDWKDYYTNTSGMLHADIMYIDEYDIGNDILLTVSNHGGISTSYDQAHNFGNIATHNLNVSQYYSVATHPDDNLYILAGSQDQGIQRGREFSEPLTFFEQVYRGDFGHLQFTNQNRSLWAVFPTGILIYFADIQDPNPVPRFYTDLPNRPDSIWIPPIIVNPAKPNSVLMGGGSGDSNDDGSYILEISVSDIGNFEFKQRTFDFSIYDAEISAMSLSHFIDTEMYTMLDNGLFFKSTDGGKNFILKNNGLPEASKTYGHKILVSKKDSKRIIVSGSGYGVDPVFESTDGGESFHSISAGLPPTTVFDMDYSSGEELIYAATEAGPYVYIRKEQKWFDMSQGQSPNQTYWSVEYLDQGKIARFGTFGRGIWDFQIQQSTSTEEIPLTEVAEDALKVFNVFPNPATDIIHVESSKDGQIQIVNAAAQVVLKRTHKKDSPQKIDITHYANGIYYLIFDDGNKISSQILVKI